MSSHVPAPRPAPSAPPAGFDLKRLYHTLVERLWLVAICVVLAALVTAGYIRRQPTLYSANAVVQVEQEEARVVKVDRIQQEDLRWGDALRTIEQTLKSRTVLERVVDSLNLTKDLSFVGTMTEPTKEQAAAFLDRMVSVRLRRNTRLLDVSVTHPNPELTAKIANAVVNEFLAENYQQSAEASDKAASFLTTEGRRLQLQLSESEKALQEFRDQSKSVSLEERNDVVNAKLKELNAKLTEANSIIIRLKTELAQIEKLGTNVESLLVLSVVNSDPAVTEARSTISKLESEFAALKQRYKYAHPRYIAAESGIAIWRANLTNAVLKVPQTLRSIYESSVASEKALHEEFVKQENLSRQLTKDLTEYNRRAREVESVRMLYDAVQQRLKEAMLTRELKPSKVQLSTAAIAPQKPFSPNKTQLMIRGVLAGLVLGVLVALGLNALDSSLKTVDDAEEYLHLPVLTAVPKVKTEAALVMSDDAKSAAAEAFRTLRTSVSMLGRVEQRRTFLFTSALPQEGKTFCSLNFALCLAQQGLKTLIIDGDLRRPTIEKVLMPRAGNKPGVTDYLAGHKELKEIVQETQHPNFHCLVAGTTAPNPAELVAQGHFDALLEEALLHYDRVVVDSAPIHAVSDTLMMLNKIQTVCLVVRTGKTPRKAVARAMALLEKANAPLAGLILNRQRRGKLSGGYYDPYYTYSYYGKYAEKGVYGT
jgi:polysaccharide biosynthesis transport protein